VLEPTEYNNVGAESLAIFGIACNVMQVISFAHDSITVFKQLHHEGCADPSLRKAADQMRDTNNSLVDSINVNCGNARLTAEEAELLELANECSGIAKKLSDELNKLANASSSKTISGTVGPPGTTAGAQKTVKTSSGRLLVLEGEHGGRKEKSRG